MDELYEECKVNVASERADVMIAAVYNLSRNAAGRLIMSERVSINDKTILKNSVDVKTGDKVTVQKYGSFLYDGIENTSKKGRYFVKIRKIV